MTQESAAYVTAIKSAINSSFEEKKTLKEYVCDELKRKGKGHSWLWILFALCFIGNATFYSQLYFDIDALKEPPAYFCLPKELKSTNWTTPQIQELSSYSNSTQSCMALKLNYKYISTLSYEDALDYVNNQTDFEGGMCSEIGGEIFILNGSETTYAGDLNLLCDGFDLGVYAGFYKGCIWGGAVFGVLGDRLGRKTSFNIAIIPFIVSAFLPAYFNTVTVYKWSRFIVGFTGYGIVNLLFVILVENSQRKLREILSIVINLTVSFGMMWQYTASYEAGENIRSNQILLTISTAVLIFFVRYLVDSPRHLISKKKYKQAYFHLKGKRPAADEFIQDDDIISNEFSMIKSITDFEPVKFFCSKNYCFYTWLCIAIYGFWFLAFNFCDMKVESQDFISHIKLLTIYDALGYICIAFFVSWLPRRVLHISMIVIFGTLLILGAALPSEELPFYQFLLTICRCFGNPAIGLFCLHIAEIFPTEIRSTAIGVTGSIGYACGYYASSIVEAYQNAEETYNLPNFTTLLGIASILISFLIYLLPETKNEELKEFVTEKINDKSECETDEKNNDKISIPSVLFLSLSVLCFTAFLVSFNVMD